MEIKRMKGFILIEKNSLWNLWKEDGYKFAEIFSEKWCSYSW